MAIFYRGVGVGTYWHQHDPSNTGFTAHHPGMDCTTDRIIQHVAQGTTLSPYVSLTRSYGVARTYAIRGRATPSPTSPAYVFEIEISDPAPRGMLLLDPVKEIANFVPSPLATVPYQHDGEPTFLIGLIDPKQDHLIRLPCPEPPGSNPPPRATNLTPALKALVCAIRDAEILATGVIPASCIRNRLEIY